MKKLCLSMYGYVWLLPNKPPSRFLTVPAVCISGNDSTPSQLLLYNKNFSNLIMLALIKFKFLSPGRRQSQHTLCAVLPTLVPLGFCRLCCVVCAQSTGTMYWQYQSVPVCVQQSHLYSMLAL